MGRENEPEVEHRLFISEFPKRGWVPKSKQTNTEIEQNRQHKKRIATKTGKSQTRTKYLRTFTQKRKKSREDFIGH